MDGPSPTWRRWTALATACLFVGTAGCSGCDDKKDDRPPVNIGIDADVSTSFDTAVGGDTGGFDADTAEQTDTEAADTHDSDSTPDTSVDSGAPDTGSPRDTSAADTTAVDTAPTDTGAPDTGPRDTGVRDTGVDTSMMQDTGPTPPQGLSTPCSNGSGWTLFKFHYAPRGGPSPRVDVWDASCNYSFAPGSACNVRAVRSPSHTSRTNAIILTSSQYIRVRYSVQGLQFTQADLYVQARSYSTTASTDVKAWSPIYGANTGGLVDNDFTYDWYHIPWSNYLSPGDKPSLTAIELSDAQGGSGKVAVQAVELCIQ